MSARSRSVMLSAVITSSVTGLLAVAGATSGSSLWARDNLTAWTIYAFDATKRTAEERAQMLERLGFSSVSHDFSAARDINTFEAEVDALQRHRIQLLGWGFPFDADDPLAKKTLEVFKRHDIRPRLWLFQSSKLEGMPKTRTQHARLLEETRRIQSIAKLAAAYGCKIALYNHNGWFGMMENQVAIIKNLQQRGVRDVGIVYNFSHARDELHDDTKDFPALWTSIRPYVVQVNITGVHWEGKLIYPSQGDSELAMMRTIQSSEWKGPVGLIAEKGGDAEVTLRNYLIGLDWLAAELRRPGSGGPRPFPLEH